MILAKNTVKPKSLFIMCAVANVAEHLGFPVTITSGNDSQHINNSLHYQDKAIDVRSKNFPNLAMKKIFLDEVLDRLGSNYQGLIENLDKDNEHFHFEFDPK